MLINKSGKQKESKQNGRKEGDNNMGAIKAKPIRLIDILGCMNLESYVVITFNNGRNSYSNTVRQAERDFSKELGAVLKGLTVSSGVLQVFI